MSIELLNKAIERYEDLSYEILNGSRFVMKDNRLSKEFEFKLKRIDVSNPSFLAKDKYHNELKQLNDYEYKNGYGFYLDGYAEFGVTGFMDENTDGSSFEIGKLYRFGNYEFEISKPSSLFSFLTHFEDESKFDFHTIKLRGVSREKFVLEVEKAIFYIGVQFKADIVEEYSELLYPRIFDFREMSMTFEYFDYTEMETNLDWNSQIMDNISLFNQGESTDYYNFFTYYRFMETFFGVGNEENELIGLVESIKGTKLLGFAKEHMLIEANGTAKSLAKALYRIRNNYVHHKLRGSRLFDPTFNIPVTVLAKWRVVTREIAIQLLNKHGKEKS